MIVAQMELTEDLHEARILSETGRQLTLQWVRSLENLSPEFRGLHLNEILPTPLRGDLSSAGRAFNKLQTYCYLSDSLVNAGVLPGPLDNSRKDQLRRGSAVLSMQISSKHPPASAFTSTSSTGLAHAAVDSAFARELEELRYFISKVDTSVFVRYGRPQDLANELYTLNVVDSLFVVEVSRRVECGQIMNAAGVLEHVQQSEHDRAWAIQEREKRLALINALVQNGSLSTAESGRISGSDPYYIPDRFDIAIASSPHAIVDCTGPPRSLDEYYRTLLDSVRDVVPELHPTDVRMTLTPLDTTSSWATHLFECTFSNAGYEYSFIEYDGHRAMSRRDTMRRSCYSPLSCISALNKALCDIGSDKRLVKFEKHPEETCTDYVMTRMVLAFMEQDRCGLWWPEEHSPVSILSGIPLSNKIKGRCGELFLTTYCRDSIQSVIDLFQDNGVLAHLSKEEILAGIDRSNRSFPADLAEVMLNFRGVAYRSFDVRYRSLFQEGPGVLAAQLDSLSSISHGKFQPTDVKEKWTGRPGDWRRIRLSFNANGRRYEGERDRRRFLDVDFEPCCDLVPKANQALSDAGIDGRFCALPFERGRVVVFLSKTGYDALSGVLSRYNRDPWKRDP